MQNQFINHMTKSYISDLSKESQFSKSEDYCVLNNQNKKIFQTITSDTKISYFHAIQNSTFIYVKKNSTNNSTTYNNTSS